MFPARFRAGLTPDTPITLAHDPQPAAPTRLQPRPNHGLRRHPRELLRALRIALTTVLLTTVAYATTLELLDLFLPRNPLPSSPITLLEPFRVANQYGLFANMTPRRYEIEFQGSDDGQAWTPYPFRFKPQDPRDRPRIYAPYQPRFDWNLWFASLTSWQGAPIVPRTEIRLLQGSPQTLTLFRGDPFPRHPPRFVRAVLYQYRFSTPAQHRAAGLWWTRQLLGTYAPTLTLQPGGQAAAVALPHSQRPAGIATSLFLRENVRCGFDLPAPACHSQKRIRVCPGSCPPWPRSSSPSPPHPLH